jgi:hypothetical protein
LTVKKRTQQHFPESVIFHLAFLKANPNGGGVWRLCLTGSTQDNDTTAINWRLFAKIPDGIKRKGETNDND